MHPNPEETHRKTAAGDGACFTDSGSSSLSNDHRLGVILAENSGPLWYSESCHSCVHLPWDADESNRVCDLQPGGFLEIVVTGSRKLYS